MCTVLIILPPREKLKCSTWNNYKTYSGRLFRTKVFVIYSVSIFYNYGKKILLFSCASTDAQ